MTMSIVANGRYLGGGFQAAPQASISDGLFDITILKNSGSFKMLDEFVSMKSDADFKHEDMILYLQAKKVSLKSKKRDITVTVDGEPILRNGIIQQKHYSC
jgi:diacylglycerol kinase (ATP)